MDKDTKQELRKFLKFWTDLYCKEKYDDVMIEYVINLYMRNNEDKEIFL